MVVLAVLLRLHLDLQRISHRNIALHILPCTSSHSHSYVNSSRVSPSAAEQALVLVCIGLAFGVSKATNILFFGAPMVLFRLMLIHAIHVACGTFTANVNAAAGARC